MPRLRSLSFALILATPVELPSPARAGENLILGDAFESRSVCAWDDATNPAAYPISDGIPVASTTAGAPVQFEGSCISSGAPERVFRFVATLTGNLTVTAAPQAAWDIAFYVRSSCSEATELVCRDNGGDSQQESATIAVVAGSDYFIFVDGAASAESGTFQVAAFEDPAFGGPGGKRD